MKRLLYCTAARLTAIWIREHRSSIWERNSPGYQSLCSVRVVGVWFDSLHDKKNSKYCTGSTNPLVIYNTYTARRSYEACFLHRCGAAVLLCWVSLAFESYW